MKPAFVGNRPGKEPVVVEDYFSAAPATVFRAWTDPDIVMKWFGPRPNSLHSASIDLRQGGAWRFLESMDDENAVGFEGEYLEVEPNRRLVFSWSKVIPRTSGDSDAAPASTVEVTFSAEGTGTRVRLVHSAIHSDEMRRGFAGGWERGFNNLSAWLPSAGDSSHPELESRQT
jgi:uncharacterized protein YndB with AHSA1/START domain